MARPSRTAFTSFCLTAALLTCAGLPSYGQSSVNLRILPLGDSITVGLQSTTGNGYRGPLATALAGQVGVVDLVGTQISGTMADADHEGHSAYKISDVASVTNAALNTYKPNVVLLDAGINDLGQKYDISDAPSRLGSLIDQILSAEPDAAVLVAQLIIDGDATVESERKTFNSQLPAVIQARANAGKHVLLVDMSALTLSDLSGTLHPNDGGYQKMANAWDSSIQKAIANRWIADPLAGSASRPTGNIYSGVAGLCLDDYGNSGTPNTKADMYGCNTTAAQQWNLNNGAIAINGLCLDIAGGGTGNGTQVDVWNCTGAANQVWRVQNGALVNPASGRCLDDPYGSTTGGTQLEIYDCNGGAGQQWRVPSQGSVVSGVSGKCLDAFGGAAANLTRVDSYGCNSTAAQQWLVKNNTLSFDGKCMDINGGSTASGAPVELYTCTGGANQVWTPVNGALVNPASGRCLTIPGNATDGAQLDIEDCHGGNNQRWTLPQL